jgi:hypothetical protein
MEFVCFFVKLRLVDSGYRTTPVQLPLLYLTYQYMHVIQDVTHKPYITNTCAFNAALLLYILLHILHWISPIFWWVIWLMLCSMNHFNLLVTFQCYFF